MNTTTDSVRIALFDQLDPTKFVVVSETDDPENFKLPGGRFDRVDETADEAVARELEQELGVSAQQVGLEFVDVLTNDDGVSRRFIYAGRISLTDLHPTDEIHEIKTVSADTIPEGKNQSHIRSAVLLGQQALAH